MHLGVACRQVEPPVLEQRLGKPVLANNLVTAWHAYRHCGLSDTLPGRGIVLREH